MALRTKSVYLPEDLEDSDKTGELNAVDRDALLKVSGWVKSFVACPHHDLGRDGTVCPFVPGSLERQILFLAVEHIDGFDAGRVATLMDEYRTALLELGPSDSDDAIYRTIIVVFTDLPAQSAGPLFADVLDRRAVPAYEDDGVLLGPFYEGNESGALYNSDFHPFQSPTPFLFVRHTVVSDWKFLLGNDTMVNLWAQRFGPAGALALARELRTLPWQNNRGDN